MGKKILKNIATILVIIAMTMGNFAIICANAVTYALDNIGEISTNHQNVEFSAVLKNESGKENTELDVKTNENDLKLHMKVTVKQEGYFAGTIVLDTSNFKLKSEILSEGITKIEGNTILLSQINAGQTRDLLVGIEPIKEEAFDLSLLSMESTIELKGLYRDSTEKDIEIKAKRKIKLELISPYNSHNTGNILNQEVITNKIISKDGENKRIIQMEIESGLEGNLYPVEEEKLEIQVPKIEDKNPEIIEISSMEELVTNGKKIEEGEYTYNEKEGKIEINIKNEAKENKVVWKKEGTNKIIVTYIYGSESEIEKQEIEIRAERKLYDTDKTVITGKYVQEIIQEEKDNIVRIDIKNKEDNIYKGKIQEGIERELTENVGIEITAKNIADKIEIEENNSEINLQNVYAKKTIINKNNIENILGENGNIVIYNADTTEIIAKIDKNTEIDESGKILTINEAEEIAKLIASGQEVRTSNNIVVTYPEGVSRIGLQINNPEKSGKITIENVKVIKQNTREQVQTINSVNYILDGRYIITDQEKVEQVNNIESKKANLNLLNTETSAKLEINKTELSTMTENKGVEIRVVLQTNNEKYDLYKNPTLKIGLPKVIQAIKVNSINLLYAENELKIVNPRLNTQENAIEITLEGEQHQYDEQTIEGPTIIINADMVLDKKAGNSTEQIKLNYTNEKATTYEGGTERAKTVDIAIKSYAGVITTTEIPEYGVEVVNNQGTKDAKLELGAETKTATLQGGIINNNETPITDVKILGTYPTKDAEEGNNIETKVGEITGIDESKVKVFYTENAEATDELEDIGNGWTEQLNNDTNVKKYLIKIDKMENKEQLSYNYTIQIPRNLDYNYVAKYGYEVNYLDSNLVKQKIDQDVLTLETGAGPVVEATLKALNGPEEVTDTILGGAYLTYQITLKNTGTEEAQNIFVEGQVPEGTVLVEDKGSGSATTEMATDGELEEYPEKREIEFIIDKLEPNESIIKEYIVKVKNTNNKIENEINIQYNNLVKKSNKLVLNVKESELGIKIYSVDIGDKIVAGYGYSYVVVLDNLTNKILKNINIEVDVGIMDFKKIRIYSGNELLLESLQNEFVLNEIDSNASINMIIDVSAPIEDNNTDIQKAYVKASVNGNIYYSNVHYSNLQTYELQIINTSINSGECVNIGDNIIYDIIISNNDTKEIVNVNMKDVIPDYAIVNYIKKNNINLTEADYYFSYDDTENSKIINVDSEDILLPGERIEYQISINLEEGIIIDETMELLNKAYVYSASMQIDNSEVMHILLPNNPENPDPENPDIEDPDIEDPDPENPDPENPDPENPDIEDPDPENPDPENPDPENPDPENPDIEDPDPENPDPENPDSEDPNPENPDPEDPADPVIQEELRIISGVAWLDSNENGQRDSDEELLSGITVKILDVNANDWLRDEKGNIISTVTNSRGFYTLNDISQGQYIVIFEYDVSKYIITDYQKEGVSSQFASKAIEQALTIDGETKDVGATEIINITDTNVANINIGLKKAKIFDFKLDKYVTKIITQNSKGTMTSNFGEATIAKAEIDAKVINGTNVIVEYKIKVTNEGEIPGYVGGIVDYVSSEYKFNSELNSDWYEIDGKLYNVSLMNTEIKPGESREISLVLTKNMTENSTGLISNTAEIAELYNEYGVKDIDSTELNNAQGEDDLGKADVILSIKTGQVILTVVIGFFFIILLGVIILVIIKIISKKE